MKIVKSITLYGFNETKEYKFDLLKVTEELTEILLYKY